MVRERLEPCDDRTKGMRLPDAERRCLPGTTQAPNSDIKSRREAPIPLAVTFPRVFRFSLSLGNGLNRATTYQRNAAFSRWETLFARYHRLLSSDIQPAL